MQAARYWHTLRHLKPIQLVGRVRFRLSRPSPDERPAPPLRAAGPWVQPAQGRASLLGSDRVRFLNVERTLAPGNWEPEGAAKLWTYNLHYFGDLTAEGAQGRVEWQRALMERWVRENPPGRGTGWEPYPASLRIVNWLKWMRAGNALSPACLHSLAVQLRWLARRLEWHLLGNHLFVNAKALAMAGLAFDGPEASEWLRTGTRILVREIPEQVLADGGQFERSPMYHALALEDMLDLLNALHSAQDRLGGNDAALAAQLRAAVEPRIEPMRRWLAAMSHPDGDISFFNDAAMGVAPTMRELEAYAARLGRAAIAPPSDGALWLRESGYVRLQRGAAVALLDVAPIGPDYLPGHAHADTLSCELSVHGARVVVNSGTSEYGVGPERLRQRGTAAHSTVTVEGADSSEVWGGFRVARRAYPVGLEVHDAADGLRVRCGHDGYRRLRGAPMHVREWRLTDASLEVHDTVGNGARAQARWHLAPQVQVTGSGPFDVRLPGAGSVRLSVEGAHCELQRSTWHPEFGLVMPTTLLDCRLTGGECLARFSWS